MPYHDEAAIRLRFNTDLLTQLTDDNGDGTADAGVIAGIVADVDNELFAIIGSRYPSADPANFTPADAPRAIRSRAVALSIHYIKNRQARGSTPMLQSILEWLEKVADGTYIIPGLTPAEPELTTLDRAREFSDREFARGGIGGGLGERLPAGGSDNNEILPQDELIDTFLP